MTDIIFGHSASVWQAWIQLVTLFLILRYVYDTYRTARADTYFEVMKSLNNTENDTEIRELKRITRYEVSKVGTMDDWPTHSKARQFANNVTNRYQIVAHMVERGFLDKVLFFENFSGTLMNVWDVCAPFIAEKRIAADNVIYLRRDLERLALESWLYQCSLGFRKPINVLDNEHAVTKVQPNPAGERVVRHRIRALRRRHLLAVSYMVHRLANSKKVRTVGTGE